MQITPDSVILHPMTESFPVSRIQEAARLREDARRMRLSALLATEEARLMRHAMVRTWLRLEGTAAVLSQTARRTMTDLLEGSIQISRADMGNIQILDPSSGSLRIEAQWGFDRRFLRYFEQVHQGEAACGAALERGTRVTVWDVTKSPVFRDSPALEVMLDAGARAVQSTPLISSSGRVLGMISTHYRRPQDPDRHDFCELDVMARGLARFLELQPVLR